MSLMMSFGLVAAVGAVLTPSNSVEPLRPPDFTVSSPVPRTAPKLAPASVAQSAQVAAWGAHLGLPSCAQTLAHQDGEAGDAAAVIDTIDGDCVAWETDARSGSFRQLRSVQVSGRVSRSSFMLLVARSQQSLRLSSSHLSAVRQVISLPD